MTAGPVDTATAEPRPAPEEPSGRPPTRIAPARWVRENLFPSPLNGVLTVVVGLLIAYLLYRATRFVFVTARWEVLRLNLTNFMVGRFPRGELYRIWLAAYVGVAAFGVSRGLTRRSREAVSWPVALRRAAPPVVGVLVVCTFVRTATPLLLVAGAAVVGVAAYAGGTRLPDRLRRYVPVIGLVAVALAYTAVTAFGGVGWDAWGGLLLTLFVAIGGIVLSFPFGVLLALGRRSSFPAVRAACVGYIELIRGVPLITLLFIGALVLGFFLPPALPRPGLVMRALIAVVLFSSAYIAEIVRGGLQSVPRGQTEAAMAIGLSPVKTTFRIVLPQALRNVIPALVGQFISLFKDTSLLQALSLLEIFGVARTALSQPDFVGQRVQAETFVFAAFLYWTACYSMSKASQRLETRLGVGTR